MQDKLTTNTRFKTALKTVGSVLFAFLLFVGALILAFVIHLLASRIPETDINITDVAQDTVFYVGKVKSKDRLGGYLSIRASGELDSSTAVISVQYPTFDQSPLLCELPQGNVEQVCTFDFYDSRAKITYRHKAVRRGKLRIQIVFSDPPPEWEHKQKKKFVFSPTDRLSAY